MTPPNIPPKAKDPPVHDVEEDLSIIYPSGDGEPMADNDWQWIAMADTAFALRNRYAGRTDVYVASDMLVYYRMNDVSARLAPDVYVVFGANGNHHRHSWLVWREGRPRTSCWRWPHREIGNRTPAGSGTFTPTWA